MPYASITIPERLKAGECQFNTTNGGRLNRGKIKFTRADNKLSIYFYIIKAPVLGYETDSTTAIAAGGADQLKLGVKVQYGGQDYVGDVSSSWMYATVHNGDTIAFHRNGGVSNYRYGYNPSSKNPNDYYTMDSVNKSTPSVTIDVPESGDIELGVDLRYSNNSNSNYADFYGELTITETRDVPDPEPEPDPDPEDPILENNVYVKIAGEWKLVM